MASNGLYSLSNKVVIVTGASEGIGAHVAAELQKRGALLALIARNREKLSAIARPLDLGIAGDLTDAGVRAELIEKTMERWGRIDVLINNAGRGSYYSACETPMDEARAVFELNFFAALDLVRLAAPHIRKTRGTIVNVSSIAGQISLPWLPVYSASKFALAAITSAQRTELARDGVNVMGVFPGYVDTDFQAHAEGPRPPARVVQSRRFAVSAQQCAEAIVEGIERRRSSVVTPKLGWALVLAHRLLPGFIESRLERVRENA
jgi:short-subunit dehydrogenase